MRLVSFRTKNFKSIKDTRRCRVQPKDNILVLPGQNEAGKSAVIESLNFFRNGPTKSFESLDRRLSTHPMVSCTFDFENSEIENVLADFGSEKLVKHIKGNHILTFVRGSTKEDDFDETRFSQKTREKLLSIFPKSEPKVPPQEATNEEATVPDTPKETKAEAEVKPIVPESKPEPQPDIDKIEKAFVKNLKNFIYYDSFKDLLPGEVEIANISKFPAVLDFEKVFRIDFSETIKEDARTIKYEENRIMRSASGDLNTYWKQKLEEGDEYNFSVKITAGKDANDSKVEFYIERGDNDPLHFQQKSKGFQWFSAFNLRLRAHGIDKDEIKNLVILIDEPGQGLHEKAQADVKNVLEELAERRANYLHNPQCPTYRYRRGQICQNQTCFKYYSNGNYNPNTCTIRFRFWIT